MNAWNATEGGPCFFRPTGIYCTDKNPEAAKTVAACFDLTEEGDYVIKPGRESCCKDASVDERGVQHGGCHLSSIAWYKRAPERECWADKGSHWQFALNMEYGFYHNISVDEQHRPHGCKVLKQNMYAFYGCMALN